MKRIFALCLLAGALALHAQEVKPLPPGLKALLAKAEGGDAEAQWKLADAYTYGRNVAINRDEGFVWASKAAGQNHPKALFMLAGMHRYEFKAKRDLEKSDQLFKQAFPGMKAAAEKGFE